MDLPLHNPNLVVPTDGYWDPDATNGLRAQSARSAMLHYHRERGFDSDEATCTVDLITDLLHHIHSLGKDPRVAIQKARSFFESEAKGTALQSEGSWTNLRQSILRDPSFYPKDSTRNTKVDRDEDA